MHSRRMESLLRFSLLLLLGWSGFAIQSTVQENIYQDIAWSVAKWEAIKMLPRKPKEEICFENLGCFSNDEGPMSHLDLLPQTPEEIGTQFILDHNDPEPPETLDPDALQNSGFRPTKPTKIIVHGFASDPNKDWITELRQGFHENGDFNIITVGWTDGASSPNYIQAAVNAQVVGRQIANFIAAAVALGSNIGDIHLVGASLGAHVNNFVANWLRDTHNGLKIGRITGLDAARPFFKDDPSYGLDTHLDAGDAEFVDVIHSNAGLLIAGCLGIIEPIGTVDFYPNGGSDQPGCNNLFFGALEDFFTGDDSYICNHHRANYFFIESLKRPQCTYTAIPCSDLTDFEDDFVHGLGSCFTCGEGGCGQLGINAHGQSSQYLITLHPDQEAGHCGFMWHLSIKSTELQELSTYGEFRVTLQWSTGYTLGPFSITEEDELMEKGQAKGRVVISAWDSVPVEDPATVILEYVAYDGWIFNGKDHWLLDTLIVKAQDGRSKQETFCAFAASTSVRSTLSSGLKCLNKLCFLQAHVT
ncbi:unnamed protein product [Darwinula stevensoni]|uniref:Lipase domain-containing protein n=1 Tax=Darwinula stevensoni TaxID=69355 RepID=A0A7R8X7M0_9CRUS|nr:unnamed protein product [Darwinula stevensoni]CAG0887180.1 unnamed protein product [Darwinula stevensoni]